MLTKLLTKPGQAKPNLLISLAGGRGFEPRLMESESIVLPLDDPPEMLASRKW